MCWKEWSEPDERSESGEEEFQIEQLHGKRLLEEDDPRTRKGYHLRAVTDADDDDDNADNAGRHSTTTRATYRQ